MIHSIEVSIITPIFNKIHSFKDTFESILYQSFSNWECLLIDDGSDKASLEFVRELSSKDKRFRLIQRDREPKGASTCRNIGIENARGEYLIFFDSDDLFLPYALEERAKEIEENSDKDFLVFSCSYLVDGQQDLNLVVNRNPVNWNDNYLKMFLRYELPWNIMCPVWKRNFIEKIGKFNENFERLQDVELHTRALARSDNFSVFSKVDCLYRVDNSSKERYSEVPFIEKLARSYREYIIMVSGIEGISGDRELYSNLRYGFNFLFRSFFMKLPLNKSNDLNKLFNEAYYRKVIPLRSFVAFRMISGKGLNRLFENRLIRKLILKLFFPVSKSRKNITGR